MAKAKIGKKDRSKRDFAPHDTRVREMSNKRLYSLSEQGNDEARKELSRRAPTGAEAKAAHQAKNAARRDAVRDYAVKTAAGQAEHSGDVRKMKFK
jgi:hypothetical protein